LEELEALKLGKQSQGLDLSSEEEEEPTSTIRRGGGGFSNVRSNDLTIIIDSQFPGSSCSKITMSRAMLKRKNKPRQLRNAKYTLFLLVSLIADIVYSVKEKEEAIGRINFCY
jgi:hypothetical protein